MRETRLIWKNMIENNQCLSSDESTELSQKPDDVPRILMAILSCSFVWAFGAIAIMSSAFITIDCGDCWLLGKFAISCSFMSLFVYATEIFPTSIRNVLIGMCSVVSRIGGIAAPYIRFFGSISPVMPIIILGTMSSVAGILTVLLPETHRKPLPVTIKQIPKE